VSWLFWALAAIMTGLVVVGLLWPLGRRRRPAEEPYAQDLAVYRDQLGELDREAAQGLLTPEQAEAARLEVQRRLLAADARRQAARRTAGGAGSTRLWLAGLTMALPVAALAIYLTTGNPGLPSLPFADRAAERDAARSQAAQLQQMAAALEQRVAQAPDDARAWELLGRTRANLGRPAEAATALAQALKVGEPRADLLAALGEMLVLQADGTVTPKAEEAFGHALKLDPREPRARYYQGLAAAQRGDNAAALQVWQALAADSTPDAPWLPLLRRQIQALQAPTGGGQPAG